MKEKDNIFAMMLLSSENKFVFMNNKYNLIEVTENVFKVDVKELEVGTL